MNEITIFDNPEFGTVRTLAENGIVLFCGSDVARALGYSNPRKAIIDHCKGVTKRDGVSQNTNRYGTITEQTVEMSFIPEGDVYRLIIRSKLSSAEKFERWVFDEVLPSIRKRGAYMTTEVVDQALRDPDSIIRLLSELKNERIQTEQLRLTAAAQKQTISELRPKASYYDLILQSKSTLPISLIAKDYGMSAKAMNRLLNEAGVQYRQGRVWLLYQRYAGQGYTQSRTFAIDAENAASHTYWTQKGRLFLYNLLNATASCR